MKAGLRFAIGEAADRERQAAGCRTVADCGTSAAEADEGGTNFRQAVTVLAAGHLLKESLGQLEELDLEHWNVSRGG